MSRAAKFLILSSLALAALAAEPARAAQHEGFLPPDIDYQKVCVKSDVPLRDDFNWTGKTPATSGLAPDKLINLAKLYFNGSGETVQNYKLANDIIDYLIRSQDREFKKDALQIKFMMLYSGKGHEKDILAAKKILDEMIKNRQPESYGYYGDIYAEEGNYAKAAEYYKKAYALGRNEAAVSLAYLLYEKKIPATQEEIDAAIQQAHDSALAYINTGRCNALTTMGLMYDRLATLPDAGELSAKWFEKGAALDQIVPKLYLANIIQRGFIRPYDEEHILKLWKEAADLGSDRAMYLMGEHVFLNHKNNEDLKKSAAWLEKAAKRQNVRAMEMVAALYDGRYPELKNEDKMRKWLERAVESPDAKDKTYVLLANFYEGRGDVPPEKILELYQLAANKGNYKAYVKIGDAFRYGEGAELSPVKALRYYRLAATNGETGAMKALKKAYECGIGVTPDAAQAQFWDNEIGFYEATPAIERIYHLLQAPSISSKDKKTISGDQELMDSARRNAEATAVIGLLFGKMGDEEKSNRWLQNMLERDKIENKDFPAHAILGDLYLQGEYAPKNPDEGIKLLDEAAQAWNVDAYEILGEWYMKNGDPAKAEESLKFAATHGAASAYVGLAELSLARNDFAGAASYLEQAARRHDVEAMLKLAELYQDNKDAAKARNWFDQALKNYPCDAADVIVVAGVYLKGDYGVEKNEQEAEKWLGRIGNAQPDSDKDAIKIAKAILGSGIANDPKRRDRAISILETSSEKGNSEATTFLIGLYFDKDFAGYNPEKAMALLMANAEKGNISSMLDLANMYASGYGVPPSLEKATEWLQKAADAGSPEASARLKSMQAAAQ